MSWYYQPPGRCDVCGLTESKVHTLERCRRMQKGDPLGGKVGIMPERFDADFLPEPPPPNFLGIKPPPRELDDQVVEGELVTGMARAVGLNGVEPVGYVGPDGSFSV